MQEGGRGRPEGAQRLLDGGLQALIVEPCEKVRDVRVDGRDRQVVEVPVR